MLPNAAVDWYLSTVDGDYYFYDYYDRSGSFPTIGALEFVLFVSCWTTLFVLYLFLTSTIAYTRTPRPVGRFFNERISLAVDCLSAVFWFASCISLARSHPPDSDFEEEGIDGAVITSIVIAACLWYDNLSRLPFKDED